MQISTWRELNSDSVSKITQISLTKVQSLLRGKAFLLHFYILDIKKASHFLFLLMNTTSQL